MIRADVRGRNVRVSLDFLCESSVGAVVKFAEVLDVLQEKGYKIIYDADKISSSKAKRKKKAKKPLSESEVRDFILEGVRDGLKSREIYDDLRAKDKTVNKFQFAAYFKHVHGGTYHKRGLL